MKALALFCFFIYFTPGPFRLIAQQTSGIGVALKTDGDNFVIGGIIPDTPAAYSNAIHIGDRLIAVAQDNQSAITVKGLRIEDVVSLLRGAKGTAVRLTIIGATDANASATVVSIERDVLQVLARWGDGNLLAGGTKAPKINLKRIDGGPDEEPKAFLGKIIVLEFWASWCGPCQIAMANLQTYSEYSTWRDEVVLIAASVDDTEDVARRHLMAKGWNKTHNVWVASDDIKAYHVNALPTTYIIDKSGNIVTVDRAADIPIIVNRLLDGK